MRTQSGDTKKPTDPDIKGISKMRKAQLEAVMVKKGLDPTSKTKDEMVGELKGWSVQNVLETGRVASASTTMKAVARTSLETFEIHSAAGHRDVAEVGSESSDGMLAEDAGIDETDFDATWKMVGERPAKRQQ